MADELHALRTYLDDIARRRSTLAWRRGWTTGAAVAAAVLLGTLLVLRLASPGGVPFVLTVAAGLLAALAAVVVSMVSSRTSATPVQIARLVEEKHGGLDDVVVTAVDYAGRDEHIPLMADRLASAALRAVSAIGPDVVVDRESLTRAGRAALAATAALIVAALFFARPLGDAAGVAAAYLLPSTVDLTVEPGDTKVRAGQPVTIRARIRGAEALAPSFVAGTGNEAEPVAMTRTDDGSFVATLAEVSASFTYRVIAGARRSADFTVTVVHPPTVEQIALDYIYPRALGFAPRREDDGGDIYAPAGTQVRFTVTTDRPVSSSALMMADGTRVPLHVNGLTAAGEMTVAADGSYRVALVEDDGVETPDDTEYFIRMLMDRPPDVRVLRPAGDKQVTPLEEVLIEARADDDFGVRSLDLVLQKPGDPEVIVPLPGARAGLTATGNYTLYLEDLEVSPGDFVTYFVRARDIGRGKPSSESRSDIFFLEVKAFNDEFVAAQSQAMAGGQSQGVQDLAAAQKEIVVATWKLDSRGRRARNASSTIDIRALATAQKALEQRAAKEAGNQIQTPGGGDPRRRRGRATLNGVMEDPIGLAIEAMRRSAAELDRLQTSAAMPHQLEALNQLLRAESDVKRRQIARQQGGGGGGGNRSTPDLSSLFDQELRKQQQTNYETPASSETRQDERAEEDPLAKLRELARRQEAMSREQRDLARNQQALEAEALKRRLERLTREQEELRRELEQLARDLPTPAENASARREQAGGKTGEKDGRGPQQEGEPQAGQQPSGSVSRSGSSPAEGSSKGGGSSQRQAMRDAAEDMRRATSGLQQQDPGKASENAERAVEQMRRAEQSMRGATADDRRRQLGDLQLESRQLADEQRRLAGEMTRAGQTASGSDERRQTAGDQDRLAGRAERLEQQLRELGRQARSSAERDAVDGAAKELEAQRVAERMRETATRVRGGKGPGGAASTTTERREPGAATSPPAPSAESQPSDGATTEIARALDRVAERLDDARSGDGGNAQRLSDELTRTQDLRDRLSDVERSLERLSAQERPGERGAASPTAREGSKTGERNGAGTPASERRAGSENGQGDNSAEIGRLQRQVAEQMRETRERVEAMSRANPEMRGPSTPEQWQPSVSAPGTEAFKQDFARWESLKNNLLLALEKVERSLTTQLRDQETKDRLNAGASDAVPDDYRALVEKYYRSLAAPRRPGSH